jgi:hypothetical protein
VKSLKSLFFVTMVSLQCAAQVDFDSLLQEHYPQVLLNREAEASAPYLSKETCYTVFGHDPGLPDYVIAGYADGALLLLKRAGERYERVSEITVEDFSLGGFSCNVSFADIDRQGRPEIALLFFGASPAHGHSDWYFSWENDRLENIGPVEPTVPGAPETKLYMSRLIDIDHDGFPEIISNGADDSDPVEELETWQVVPPQEVHRRVNGVFTRDRTLTFAETFSRSTGKPKESMKIFGFGKVPQGPLRLKIINGDADAKHRVTSAHVWLNGRRLASPKDFNEHIEFLVRDVILKQKNEIKVLLAGAPDSNIKVVIEPAQ